MKNENCWIFGHEVSVVNHKNEVLLAEYFFILTHNPILICHLKLLNHMYKAEWKSLQNMPWYIIFCIYLGTLRHKFRVPTTHTSKNFFFRPYQGGSAILSDNLGELKQLQMSWNFFCGLITYSIIRKYNALNEFHKWYFMNNPNV